MKRKILFLLVCIFCCFLYAQDSIVVYQGNNTHKFLLSDIDSITHAGNNTMNLYHNLQRTGYSVTTVDSITIKEGEQNEIEDITITNIIDWNAIGGDKNSYKLLSFQQEIAVSEDSPNVITPTVRCNTPQVMLLLNANDEIMMMSKGVYDNEDVNLINAHSTAIALVAIHPIFGYVPSNDYETLVQLITNSSYFDALELQIAKAIEQGISPLQDNSDIISAFSTLMEDLTSADFDNSNDALDVLQSRVPRRAIVNIGDLTNIGPFQMHTIGERLMIYTGFVTPYYEGTVTTVRGTERLDIPSGDNLGIISMLNQPVGQEPNVTFDFNGRPEGEYRFHFDRTTTRANVDYVFHIIGDVLDVIGLPLSRMEMNSLIEGMLLHGALYFDQILYATQPQQAIEIATTMVLDYFSTPEFTQFMASNGRLIAARTFLNRISVVMTWYQAIRGSANTITRIVLRQNSPQTIDFRLCYNNETVSACTEVKLEKTGGDNQEGYKGERLLNALEVKVYTYADDGTLIEDRDNYYRVKYSVESGGGRLSWNEDIVSYGFATTFWWLGYEETEQKVRACVVDIATGQEISEPVYFTAKISDKTNITFRLDWNCTLYNSDIDLHVTCPKGHHIFYQAMSCPCGGQLDRDDRHGPGPEHIRFSNAEPGDYIVYVHHYESESHATIPWTLITKANEKKYKNVGSVPYHSESQKYKLTIYPNTSSNRRRSPEIKFEKIEEEIGPMMPDLPKKNN